MGSGDVGASGMYVVECGRIRVPCVGLDDGLTRLAWRKAEVSDRSRLWSVGGIKAAWTGWVRHIFSSTPMSAGEADQSLTRKEVSTGALQVDGE